MRNKRLLLSASLCLALVTLFALPAAAGKVYRWVDDQGVVHFGDSVPPEYATSDRDILNEQGVAVDSEEGALTPEEKAEADRLAAEEKQRKAEEDSARARDRTLLNTYLSVSEIERLRDQRKELLDGQIQLTELYLESLRVKLVKLQKDAARFRPYSDDPNAPPIHENLAKEMSDTLDSIISYEKSMTEAKQNKAVLMAKFDSDIDRFRELKGQD